MYVLERLRRRPGRSKADVCVLTAPVPGVAVLRTLFSSVRFVVFG